MDLRLPNMDGLTTFEFLNQDNEVQSTPKVFVSGRNDTETLRRCYEMSAYHVHKSLHVAKELQAVLASLDTTNQPVMALRV